MAQVLITGGSSGIGLSLKKYFESKEAQKASSENKIIILPHSHIS